MSREDLIEQRLERGIRRIFNNADEFKSRQRASGASGQLGYAIETANEWDRIETLPTTSAYDYPSVELTLTFTASPGQLWPILIPATDIRFNGTGDANKIDQDANGKYGWKSGSNTADMSSIDVVYPESLSNPTQLKYEILFYYTGSITYYVKMRGQSSTDGVWTIARTA